jgi:hypothetical protein
LVMADSLSVRSAAPLRGRAPRAQQPTMPVIGFLSAIPSCDTVQ